MKFISDVSKDIVVIAQREPVLMVTRLYTFLHDFCFYGTIPPPKSHTIWFFLAHCQNPCLDFPFSLKKREGKVKVTLIGYFNDCLFTETSTVPAQADEQQVIYTKKNRVQSQKHVATLMRQQWSNIIFDDVVTLYAAKMVRSQENKEFRNVLLDN